MKRYKGQMESPVGTLFLSANEQGLTGLRFRETEEKDGEAAGEEGAVISQAKRELEEYFAGKRTVFEVPLCLQGTPFQKKVWEALRQIPYGETRSYQEVAAMAGNPKACRAVGMANNRNPVSILVPCHRVIGKDGSLTGYGGGLDVKTYLLKLENIR